MRLFQDSIEIDLFQDIRNRQNTSTQTQIPFINTVFFLYIKDINHPERRRVGKHNGPVIQIYSGLGFLRSVTCVTSLDSSFS